MWMKIDDRLHAHRKTRHVTRSHADKARDSAPMGLWVLAGSWASQNATDGWVPEGELDRWDDDWQPLARRLVRAGYWWPEEQDGEPGFGFNDWQEWNSPAASESGVFGNHVRWHVKKGVVKPGCEHCPTEPDMPEEPESSGATRPDIAPDDRPDIGSGIAPNRLPVPVPDPYPTRPEPKNVVPDGSAADAPTTLSLATRDDVTRLCEHLADRIAEDGSNRPNIGKGWHDAARLMLDKDGRTEAEVHAAIDWCQSHHFWRANVLSMPKLREKYDQLRKVAASEQQSQRPRVQQQTDDLFDRAMGRAIDRDGSTR